MVEVIRTSIQKARRDYEDMGWIWIIEWIKETNCDISDNSFYKPLPFKYKRILVKHRNRKYPGSIIKGEMYEKQVNKQDGYMYTFRTHVDLLPVLNKYGKYIYPSE